MKVSILKFCCGKGVLFFKLYLLVGEKHPYPLGQFSCRTILASWTELMLFSAFSTEKMLIFAFLQISFLSCRKSYAVIYFWLQFGTSPDEIFTTFRLF